jgi:predicted transcriptional regulator
MTNPETETRPTATIALRVSTSERSGLLALARRNDRTVSREARRAIRYYLEHFPSVDKALCQPTGIESWTASQRDGPG